MLLLKVPLTQECWDEEKEEFIEPVFQTLHLEHSLVSLSKWESTWCKPFLSQIEKTDEEALDYIKCMTISQDVQPDIYDRLTLDNVEQINKYIESSMTATTFSENGPRKINRETITAEIIYDWMIALNIPFDCENWHINRLITLIKVRSIKNQPPRKKSRQERISQYAAINEQNKKRFNTKG